MDNNEASFFRMTKNAGRGNQICWQREVGKAIIDRDLKTEGSRFSYCRSLVPCSHCVRADSRRRDAIVDRGPRTEEELLHWVENKSLWQAKETTGEH
ncbi:hypothetical protein ACLOJK_027881 [Asimina triloba]